MYWDRLVPVFRACLGCPQGKYSKFQLCPWECFSHSKNFQKAPKGSSTKDFRIFYRNLAVKGGRGSNYIPITKWIIGRKSVNTFFPPLIFSSPPFHVPTTYIWVRNWVLSRTQAAYIPFCLVLWLFKPADISNVCSLRKKRKGSKSQVERLL